MGVGRGNGINYQVSLNRSELFTDQMKTYIVKIDEVSYYATNSKRDALRYAKLLKGATVKVVDNRTGRLIWRTLWKVNLPLRELAGDIDYADKHQS